MSDDDHAPLEHRVEALEMEIEEQEALNPKASLTKSTGGGRPSAFSQKIDQFLSLIKLYIQVYPKAAMIVAALLGACVIKYLFFRHVGTIEFVPPHMKHHFGDLNTYYELQMAKIDHWCVKGGNDDCTCEDPTEALSREEEHGWLGAYEYNKALAKKPIEDGLDTPLDVVFFGHQTVQAWTGREMDKESATKRLIAQEFAKTFTKAGDAPFEGLALGIAGDSVSLCIM
jgi:hypothetical protein